MKKLNNDLCSEIYWKTAKSLDMIFGGLHNVPFSKKSHREWGSLDKTTNYSYIEITVRGSGWATYDFNRLTQIVLAAHAYNIRIEISTKSRNHFSLLFHNRQPDGRVFERHPNLEHLSQKCQELFAVC